MQVKDLRQSIRLGPIAALSLAVLLTLAGWMTARPGLLLGQSKAAAASPAKTLPQAANPQPDAASESDSADEEDPSPGNFLGSTYIPSLAATNVPVQNAVAAPPPPLPKPVPASAPGDPARQQINNETANMLAMAYALKAEVDRTNAGMLSISVVRKASQIEQLARKVREEVRPVLSKN
jgi:hypothetical protein